MLPRTSSVDVAQRARGPAGSLRLGAKGLRARPACRSLPHQGRRAHHLTLASAQESRCVASTQSWSNNRLPWSPERSQERVTAPKDAPPLVVLPGFGNNSADYLAPFGVQDQALVTHLRERGWTVYVVPMERRDWFQVGRSLFTRGFWSSSLSTHPGYTWYLERVSATVDKALEETGAQQVDIVGHSAGGWLARAYIGDPLYPGAEPRDGRPGGALSADGSGAAMVGNGNGRASITTAAASASTQAASASSSSSGSSSDAQEEAPWRSWLGRLGLASPSGAEDGVMGVAGGAAGFTAGAEGLTGGAGGLTVNRRVRALVTLGTPHRPPPPEIVRDMTGGALTWVNNRFPGAYFKDQGVRYICVGGCTVRGDKEAEKRTMSRYAYGGYTQVCGEGQGVEGDCVVPLVSSHLPGACNITLEGAFHSMSQVGTFEEPSGNVWYGSDAVVDYWLEALVQPGQSSAAGASTMGRSRSWTAAAASEGN